MTNPAVFVGLLWVHSMPQPVLDVVFRVICIAYTYSFDSDLCRSV